MRLQKEFVRTKRDRTRIAASIFSELARLVARTKRTKRTRTRTTSIVQRMRARAIAHFVTLDHSLLHRTGTTRRRKDFRIFPAEKFNFLHFFPSFSISSESTTPIQFQPIIQTNAQTQKQDSRTISSCISVQFSSNCRYFMKCLQHSTPLIKCFPFRRNILPTVLLSFGCWSRAWTRWPQMFMITISRNSKMTASTSIRFPCAFRPPVPTPGHYASVITYSVHFSPDTLDIVRPLVDFSGVRAIPGCRPRAA